MRNTNWFLSCVTICLLPLFATIATADETTPDAAPGADIYGDPLPPGAVARLGTVRYRAFPGYGHIEFLADG